MASARPRPGYKRDGEGEAEEKQQGEVVRKDTILDKSAVLWCVSVTCRRFRPCNVAFGLDERYHHQRRFWHQCFFAMAWWYRLWELNVSPAKYQGIRVYVVYSPFRAQETVQRVLNLHR